MSPAPTVDLVVAVGHPRQRGHRLALRAGGDEHDLVVGEVVELLDVDEHAVGHVEVAEVGGDAHVAHHRAADQGDLAAVRVSAASSTCCTRCTWEEKQATMIRRSRVPNTWSSAGPMSRSGVVKPGHLGVGRVDEERSTPSSPSRAKPRRSVSRPSSGSWSILKSPVCSTVPAGVRMATASASGIEWLTATNSQSNDAELLALRPRAPSSVYGVMRCSLSLASTSARVSCEPIERDVGLAARSR